MALVGRLIAWALTLKPVRAFLLYSERRGPQYADAVTYRTLFSVFAGVLLGFSLAALWLADNEVAWNALLEAVNTAIPGLIGSDGKGIIDPGALRAPAAFTVAGIVSLIGLVGAAIGAIGALRTALRVLAGGTTDDTAWYWVILRNLLLAIGIGAALGVSAGATFLGTWGADIVLGWIGMADAGLSDLASRVVSVVVVFALDTCVVAVLVRTLSGLRPSARSLWTGAIVGGVGLTVLQELSGLFVRGASSNPLLASFASLVALLLWFNLSAQVILIAAAYVVTGVEEEADRMRARYGAATFAQHRVRRAEDAVAVATAELEAAREAERAERERA